MRRAEYYVLGTLLIAVSPGGQLALAHQLNVFAFVRSETVVVEAKFSNGREGRAGTVKVFDGNAAIAHQGVAMLSPPMWRADILAGRLVQLFPLTLFEPFAYWLVYPEHKRNVPKVKAFREWLLAEFRREAAEDESGAFLEPEEAAEA